jgi:hypothetical protein
MSIEGRKLRILNKLAASGADTEKKITALGFPDIIKITKEQKMAMTDMELILELQNAIKNRQVVAYLTGGADEKEVRDADRKDHEGTDGREGLANSGREETSNRYGQQGHPDLFGSEGLR